MTAMTQDTEDVVALTDEAIEAAAKQLRAVLDEGYDDECALSSALEMLGVETKLQPLSDRIDVLEGEKARLADRLKLLSLDVLQWWKTVFGVDYVHTLPGETPGELAARAAERIAALHQEGIAP